MKPESINRKAFDFFEQVKIRSKVEELQHELKFRNDITVDTLIQSLKEIIFFNPKNLFDSEGKLKDLSDLPNEVTSAISSIDLIKDISGK